MSVRSGIIGLGFMGMTHFEAYRQVQGGQVAAIATRNARKLAGDWSDIQGNFGPRGSAETDLTGVKTYLEYRDLLNDPDIDLVHVCLPTDQHESVTLEALAAGKHVLVEKPIAIELEAADRLLNAATKANRLLMVAHVLPFFPEFRWACEQIHSGKYGQLKGAALRRVIAPPEWSADISDFRKLGGWGIDLHIHDNHYLGLLCGTPRSVFSRGLLKEGFVNHVSTQYVYDNPDLTVSCISGGIAAPDLKFAQSFEFLLDDATIQFDAGTYGDQWVVNRPLTLISREHGVETPQPGGGSTWCAAFTEEIQAAVSAVSSGKVPLALSATLATDALKICYAEAESIRRGCAIDVSTLKPAVLQG
ncbi:Gfo/Idh/MocA family protein [Planctomicrobium piriforme]|uniref:Predicted dehydrogenase n=1 Tax=Planctomicrobium piriforme TaxID=1576369 RepID=A0A1I3NBP3_9PLAN|nr:Gfo/Idh/MocA family oxidoreductase [Planctomicrobium piriforme]SFJ06768.1 Predicted dehydrogenase [Planctomicrobium piriforme]